jgi:hypothetical protein
VSSSRQPIQLLVASLCVGLLATVAIEPALGSTGQAHVAKQKCKKSKKAATAKKKCKKAVTPVPLPGGGVATPPSNPTPPTPPPPPLDTTVYEINDGTITPSTFVRLSDLLVTAVWPDGSNGWVQVQTGDPDYEGVSFSALQVIFSGASPPPSVSVGDRITIDGTTAIGPGVRLDATVVSVNSSGETPDVTAQTAAQFAAKPTGFDGVLVSVPSLTIDSPIAGPPPNPLGGWNVSSGPVTAIDVLSGFFQPLPGCAIGTTFSSVTGLGFTNSVSGDATIGPRRISDLAPLCLTDLDAGGNTCVGTATVGTVTLSGPASGDTTVTLESSEPTDVPVPPSVTVLNGQESGSFQFTPTAEVSATITATLNGGEKQDVSNALICPP